MSAEIVLKVENISKSYGGVRAAADISFALHAGEVVALLGHNGAGKSTMVSILSGAVRPDAGRIVVADREVDFQSPGDARAAGIETIYQTLALADNMDAVANLFLGRELRRFRFFRSDKLMRAAAAEVLERVNPRFQNTTVPVRSLSGGQRQSIAIARALHFKASVLIMDEPTAALGIIETQRVKDVIRRLRGTGVTVLLITHDMSDVFDLADRALVMTNGRMVGQIDVTTATKEEILSMIIMGESGKESASSAIDALSAAAGGADGGSSLP